MTTTELITAKESEINSLKENRTGTKQEYLSSLAELEEELLDIQEQKVEEDELAAAEAKAILEASVEYRVGILDGEYNSQFQTLTNAYMAALILGDTDTMTANRVAYQALLAEYNTKRGLIV
jgi:hypothetical protein